MKFFINFTETKIISDCLCSLCKSIHKQNSGIKFLIELKELMRFGCSQGKGDGSGSGFEFLVEEVVEMASSAGDIVTGMIYLAYQTAANVQQEDKEYPLMMSRLFSAVVALIKELHDRDARRAFCPEGFWISPRLSLLADKTKRTGSMTVVYDVFEKTNPFRL